MADYDVFGIFAGIWSGVLDPLYALLKLVGLVFLSGAVLFLGLFFIKVFPFVKVFFRTGKMDAMAIADSLAGVKLKFFPYDLTRWIVVDLLRKRVMRMIFNEFGITFYVGRQGGGKTTSMVRYLREMRLKYPKLLIVSNIETKYTDVLMSSWKDFMTIRNGTDGVLFAIDEIQAEYSSRTSKDFPDELLRQVCMQRKQRIKIVCTAQYFSRVAKPLREQAQDVVVCKTILGRLVTMTSYDAVFYEAYSGGLPVKMEKKRRNWRRRYVMGDDLRNSFDTFAFVEKLATLDYSERIGNDYER